jgi:RNA polymerase sigma-70 factor (ECF subfamily)
MQHNLARLGQWVINNLRAWTKPYAQTVIVGAVADLGRTKHDLNLENALLRRIEGVEDYYPYHVARADLLRRTNEREAAADAYERALALCGNSAERAYLQRRLDEMLNL